MQPLYESKIRLSIRDENKNLLRKRERGNLVATKDSIAITLEKNAESLTFPFSEMSQFRIHGLLCATEFQFARRTYDISWAPEKKGWRYANGREQGWRSIELYKSLEKIRKGEPIPHFSKIQRGVGTLVGGSAAGYFIVKIAYDETLPPWKKILYSIGIFAVGLFAALVLITLITTSVGLI